MPNQELMGFIKKSKEAGQGDEEIKQALKSAGWQEGDIDEGFKRIAASGLSGQSGVSTQPAAPPSAAEPAKPALNYSDVLYGNNSVDTVNSDDDKKGRLKHKLFKKIIFSIIGVIILLIVFFFAFPYIAGFFVKDIAPIDDSDLQLLKVEIADNQNSYFDLIKLDKNVSERIGEKNLTADIVAGKLWDQIYVDELLKVNSVALTYFDAAANKSKFQDPVTADPSKIWPEMVLVSMNSWRIAGRISAVKALNLAKQGKSRESFDEALKSVKIGAQIQNSQPTLIVYLVAIAIKKNGLDVFKKISEDGDIAIDTLRTYKQALVNYKDNGEGLKKAYKTNYLSQKWTIKSITAGNAKEIFGEEDDLGKEVEKKSKNSFYFYPNKTIALFAELDKVYIERVNNSCVSTDDAGSKDEIERILVTNHINLPASDLDIVENLIRSAKLYFTPNAVGKILSSVMVVSLSSPITKRCDQERLLSELASGI